MPSSNLYLRCLKFTDRTGKISTLTVLGHDYDFRFKLVLRLLTITIVVTITTQCEPEFTHVEVCPQNWPFVTILPFYSLCKMFKYGHFFITRPLIFHFQADFCDFSCGFLVWNGKLRNRSKGCRNENISQIIKFELYFN